MHEPASILMISVNPIDHFLISSSLLHAITHLKLGFFQYCSSLLLTFSYKTVFV
jgi:hypothetical protein